MWGSVCCFTMCGHQVLREVLGEVTMYEEASLCAQQLHALHMHVPTSHSAFTYYPTASFIAFHSHVCAYVFV